MEEHVTVVTKADGTKEIRHDGYINLLNRYGTSQDNSQAYQWNGSEMVSDMELCHLYETNGLFAKIIDTPAEEAFKTGFSLNLNDKEVNDYITDKLDALNWEENIVDAVRWARLFGGSLVVMVIDDGGTLEDPLQMDKIKGIDEIRVYDRSVVSPDYSSLYYYNPNDPIKVNSSKFGMPQYYCVYSIYGEFIVHESRCLVFKNGQLPERVTQALYRFWGIPEYVRIQEALKETLVAHGNAGRLLERCVQAIYKMKNLAMELSTDDGEERVLKRMQIIDMARGILNSMVIDADGEDYTFEDMTLSNVDRLVDKICQMLSAITGIPLAILFGREPAGENATGESDFENWYNYLDSKIRNRMARNNLKKLIEVVWKVGEYEKKIKDKPGFKLTYNPLWNLTESEKADVHLKEAQADLLKAQTADIYMGDQVLDPSEVRSGLKKDEEMDIDLLLNEESPDKAQSEDWAKKAGIVAGMKSPAQPTQTLQTGKPVQKQANKKRMDGDDVGIIEKIRERWRSRRKNV